DRPPSRSRCQEPCARPTRDSRSGMLPERSASATSRAANTSEEEVGSMGREAKYLRHGTAKSIASKQRDTYFSLFGLTEYGAQHPEEVKRALETASRMIRETGGEAECHLFVPIGGPWDYIGITWGVDDERIVEIQQAVRAFGTFEETFVKAREFLMADFAKFIANVQKLKNLAR